MNRISTISFASLFALAAACTAQTAPEETAASTSDIIGGTPTSGYPSIVALYGVKAGEDKGALCTATVIGPRMVITAAHCVAPETVGDGLDFHVLSGADLTDKTNPAVKFHVKETHFDSAFSAKALMDGHDIAIAITDEDLPFPAMKINRAALPALTGAKLVGYGLNDGFKQTGAGIKREARVAVAGVDDKFVKTGSFFGTTMCSGDSGGPVIASVGGEDVVVAVNSFGFLYCIGTGSSTRIDAYNAFLDTYLTPPPSTSTPAE